MKCDEELLVASIMKGSEDAFQNLYTNYFHDLLCISRQYVQDNFLAETIVLDVFVHLWEIRKTLDIQVSLRAYLVRMVRNFSLNYLHKNHVEKEVRMKYTDRVFTLLFLPEEYPLDRLIKIELKEKLRKEIADLPPKTHRVFVLSRLKGLRHKEVATLLGISVNTVKYHIKQALSILRHRLKGY